MTLIDRARALLAEPDRSHEAGRAQARHRAIALTALASGVARGINLLTILISVPLTLHYLGVERYGMWMTLSAFALLLSFTDFGISNSVLTEVAKCAGRDDQTGLRRQIASAYAAMALIALAFLAILAALYGVIDWPALFNVTDPLARTEAGPAAAAFFAILALTAPIALIYRIQLGLQQGFRATVWQGAASLASLIALVLAMLFEASLLWLVVALAGAPLLVAAINALDFFARQRPDLRPRRGDIHLGAMQQLSTNGALFLILQVCAAILFQSNAIIIAQMFGAGAVAAFAVPERLFSVIGILLSLALAPLWPAYGEAVARGDLSWVRRTLRRSLIVSGLGAALLAAVFVAAGPQLLHWWVGNAVSPPFSLLIALGIWKVIESLGSAVAMFLNGVNEIMVQVIFALLTAAASIGLRIWWAPIYGLTGVVAGTIVAYLVFAVPFLGYAIRHAMARIAARQV